MTRLFIAEKPDMGRQIASALAKPHKTGDGYIETGEGIVTWCIGHIMEMANPEEYNEDWKKWDWKFLPMIPSEWKINVTRDKAKQFKTIKELIKQVDEIVNAGDPGREGQLIVDEVLHYLKNRKPVQRILLHSLDHQSVRKALSNLEDNQKFFPLYQAGLCRGYADWLMGMNATRAYTLLGQKNGYKGVLSVGRVQSPTLAIVVRRDELIENFVPQDYFVVHGVFSKSNKPFKAYWKAQDTTNPTYIDDEERIKNKQFAEDITQKIKGKNAVIKSYEEKDGKENPPMPFNLSQMQSYASSKWGMTAKHVLDVCQSLYEKHLQTYPRTDCSYLPESQFGDAPIILNNITQAFQHLKNAVTNADTNLKSSAWDDSKLGEHFGLIPTKEVADLNKLSADEQKIYQAVCERFITQFYPACTFKSGSVLIECENEIFKSTGKVIKDQGWRAVFNVVDEDDEGNKDEEEQVFPDIATGDTLVCDNSGYAQQQTKPPARFTDGTLLKAMTNVHTLVTDPVQKKKLKETKGIGREATRAQIMETLVKRGLLERKGKFLISAQAGRSLVHALPEKVVDPALTAMWENAFELVAQNKLSLEKFMEKQVAWVQQLIEQSRTATISNLPAAGDTTSKSSGGGGGGKTYQKTAPKKQSANTKANITKDACPVCKEGRLIQRMSKNTGKPFWGCSNYPKCNFVDFNGK